MGSGRAMWPVRLQNLYSNLFSRHSLDCWGVWKSLSNPANMPTSSCRWIWVFSQKTFKMLSTVKPVLFIWRAISCSSPSWPVAVTSLFMTLGLSGPLLQSVTGVSRFLLIILNYLPWGALSLHIWFFCVSAVPPVFVGTLKPQSWKMLNFLFKRRLPIVFYKYINLKKRNKD